MKLEHNRLIEIPTQTFQNDLKLLQDSLAKQQVNTKGTYSKPNMITKTTATSTPSQLSKPMSTISGTSKTVKYHTNTTRYRQYPNG